MAKFHVVPSELYATAKRLTDQARAFSEASDAAHSSADDLCGKWEGAARDTFKAEQSEHQKRSLCLANDMKLYADELSKMAKKYEEADARSAALLSSI